MPPHAPPTPPSPAAPQLLLHAVAAVRRDHRPPQALERKQAALLAWLWLQGPTPRARLAGLLWPEVGEDRARGNLRQRLLKLRQDHGDLVHDDNGLLRLAPGVDVAQPDPLDAVLLQALDFDDCETFARWLEGHRDAARGQRKRAWLGQVRQAVSGGQGQRLDDALYAADQLLLADRESEEAYRVLMEVYYLRGDHAAAIGAWDRCKDMLRQLYGVQPSSTTQQLGQTILAAAQQSQAAQAVQQAWGLTGGGAPQIPASVLRPPRLVGRQALLDALQHGWRAGHVLVVAGSAGMGKSRLLADWQAHLVATPDAAARVAAPHGAAAAAAARPGDAVLPYASISRLLLAAIDRFGPALDSAHAQQAARLLPRLATLVGVVAEPVRTDYERTQALLALARLLGDCVRRGCAAFVLDDLQFADPASLSALRVLAEPDAAAGPAGTSPAPAAGHPRATTPLRFALGVRADEASAPAQALLQALADTGRCTRVDLQPLSAGESGELLDTLGLQGVDVPTWAPRIWQQVGGNPAFLLESVKLLLSQAPAAPGAVPTALQLPASIEAVIQRRIELLSPRARHLAQLAAIAGSGYSVPLAAAALACAPLELSEPLRELELRQVFYGRRFVHDVIASVTTRSVPDAVADFMHRFVAEHLQQHGGEAAQVATHWLACGEWRRAGQAFVAAAHAAEAAALANEQAALLDQAVAAFEHDPDAHEEHFAALEERANVFESQGHEGLRPGFIERLRGLARSEAQQLSVLNHHNGWLVNLAKPLEEDRILAAIPRAVAVGRPQLAWSLTRMLGFHWAMNNRAGEGLALLKAREAWIEAQGTAADKASYRQTRSSIFAFSDQLPQAIEEGTLAMHAAIAAQDWPSVLPALSNLGLFHYWRSEFDTALGVFEQARAIREQRYGSSGSGIKIDIHLGAVLYELGRADDAQAMLEGALAEMHTWPESSYRATECLLVDNHLAQMFIALGRADEAAAVLAHDATGVAERFYGRRLTLRLRWQRVFGNPADAQAQRRVAEQRAELQAIVQRLASPFNRVLMELELARALPPADSLAACAALHDSPPAQQRPGLQLHAAVLAAQAAKASHGGDDTAAARHWTHIARQLRQRCLPFDMPLAEVLATTG